MFNLTTDNKIQIEPYYLLIPEFKSIWDGDKSKTKDNALNELKYVFFIADFKSPYKKHSINEVELKSIVKKDYMPTSWKESKIILIAIEKYKELQYSKALRLFDSADNVLSQISQYMDSFSILNTEGDSDKSEDEILKMLNIIDKIPKVTAQLEVTRNKIQKELAMKDDEIRGKGTIQKRELPKSKRK